MTTTAPTKAKKPPPSPPAKKPATPPPHVLKRWLTTNSSSVGKHPLHVMIEQAGVRASVLDDIRAVVRKHFVSPEIAAQRVADLGAPATAKILRELLPKTKTARSGDFGEVLATEIAEQTLGFIVPVRRLRWKDGRNMALRGDDIVGIRVDANGKLVGLLKGESKSYARLTSAVIEKAAEALDRDRGRPGRHAVLFIATRLRESGKNEDAALAAQLEGAVVAGFSASAVEQFLLALTGSDPNTLLTNHLTLASKKKRPRHAVGVQIADHGDFIKLLFGGL
ncbi:MAG TPA: SAVED domain-containing protein [Polyangiaceae bacterium]|nr:SAVED domain-containing protein [Thermoanaerobaculales bacterium]HQP38111.1 SAVED domain-containing protein [Polyangiaceae bacterium]